MKFFNKHKKFIARVLCVTVSLMLLISSIPVGASTISSAGYDKTLCTFSSYVGYGTSHTINNSNRVRALFSADYGLYSDGEFHFILSSPISINSSNASSKGIGFNLYFPYVLKTAGDNFKVAFKTNLKGFVLNLDGSSIISNFHNAGGDYGQIVKLQHFVDYSRISAMHDHAGDFNITGLIVIVSGGAGQVLGNNNYIAISDFYDCTKQTDSVSSSDVGNFIVNAFKPMLQLLGDGISSSINFLGYNILGPYIESILDGLEAIGSFISPVLKVMLDDLFMPVLETILQVVSNIAIEIAYELEPIISSIVNFFAPYFNDLSDLITDNFIFLIEGLEPIFNQFTADVQSSFGSIAENMVKNIRKIIEECFIPDNSSVQVKEFISIKDELTSKIPLFTQFGTFLNTLFNPDDYYVSNTVLESTYLNISSFRGYYRFNKPLPPGDYKIVFDINSPTNELTSFHLQCFNNSEGLWRYIFSCSRHNSSGNVLYFTIPYDNDYVIYEFKSINDDYSGNDYVKNITLYSLSNSVLGSHLVNYKGTPINAFNFDWYKPYKKYGDILIISFCYLAFVWRTFKRLPSFV